MIPENIFNNFPDLQNESFNELISNDNLKLERIVSMGHVTPENQWYDQSEHEWVILLSGGAEIVFQDDNKKSKLKPGDYLLIPAHCKHRVNWTDPEQETVWLALHFKND